MEAYLYESCSLASHLTYCFLGYCIRLHLCLQFLCKLFTRLSEDICLRSVLVFFPSFCWQRDPSLLLAAFGDPLLWLRSPTRSLPAPCVSSCLHHLSHPAPSIWDILLIPQEVCSWFCGSDFPCNPPSPAGLNLGVLLLLHDGSSQSS